jgi:zinc D-Ala-D-Ala carboxypeptidase
MIVSRKSIIISLFFLVLSLYCSPGCYNDSNDLGNYVNLALNDDQPDSGERYAWSRTLKQGMSGSDVRELQIRVAGWAADSPSQSVVWVDGSFGSGTAAAVRRFQSAYGLAADAVVGPATQSKLNSLQKSDGSTAHFSWAEFYSKDGAGFSGGNVGSGTVKENVRRNMYKLEALRKKCGNNSVTINSGFRSIAHNRDGEEPDVMEEMLADRAVGGEGNSQHTYGIAADIVISNRSVSDVMYQAKKSGYSGIIRYSTFTHVDSRIEYPYGAQYWYWTN